MAEVFLRIGETGQVERVDIIADSDEEAELVRLALAQWQRTAQLKSESAPVAELRVLNLPTNQEV